MCSARPDVARSTSKRVGWLLGAASGLLLVLGSTCAAFVWTPIGQRVDQRFLPRAPGGIDNRASVLYAPAHAVLSTLGNPTVLAVLLAAVVLVGVVSGRGTAGLLGVGVVGASIVAAGLLKQLVHRPELGVAGSTTHNSFPSGHVAAASGLVFAVLLALPRGARRWCAVPGAAGVSLVAAATMITGWHRLSDVIGGVLLAALLGCLAAAGRRAVAGRRAIRGGWGGSRGKGVVVGPVRRAL